MNCTWFHVEPFAMWPRLTTLVALAHRHAVARASAPALPRLAWVRRFLVTGGAQVEKQWIPTSRGLCLRSDFPHALFQGEIVSCRVPH